MSEKNTSLTFPEAINLRTGFISFLASALALVEVIRIVGFVNVDIAYFIILPLMIIPVILGGLRKCQIVVPYLLFLTYIPIEILITSPLPVFHSWQRFALFAILIIAVSPLCQNVRLRLFRFICLKYFIFAITPLSILSFFCYFLGINFFKASYGTIDYLSHVGGFGGLFRHSMILGPMCAISTCVSLWLSLRTKHKKYIFITCAILSGGCTLFSASRAAVYGTLLACIVIIYFLDKKSKGLRRLIIVAILGCASFPLWEGALYGISTKNKTNVEMGEYGSRTAKFNARFYEIQESPIIGVGFSAIDPNSKDYYNAENGVIEPGSSWLGVMSMTGVIGILFILIIFVKTYSILSRSPSQYAPLLIGLVSFFAFHLLFEGYIYAGGSVLCFIFWLIMGVAYDLKYTIQYGSRLPTCDLSLTTRTK